MYTFAVIGPTICALSNDLCDPELSIAKFGRLLKTRLFQQYSAQLSALEELCDNALYKLTSQVDGRPPVLTAISQSNGNGQTSIPHRIKTP